MKENFKKLVVHGEFLEAKRTLNELNISNDALKEVLFDLGYDGENICAYSFIAFLLIERECVELHCLGFEILTSCFAHFLGGYQTALYHMRRAIELCPENIELEEDLLFFNEIPEKLISDQEAKEIAQKIITKKPNSEAARMTLMGVKIFLEEKNS